MKKIIISTLALCSLFSMAYAKDILKFDTMYGVDGPFVGSSAVRNVMGDELPWEIKSAKGSLSTDGWLKISVKGLVFSDDPIVPPELRGINDEEEFRGLVSCLTEEEGRVTTTNITTMGFPATRSGNAEIMAKVHLPEDCVAPIIFVMSGSEDKWFSVTGAETGPSK